MHYGNHDQIGPIHDSIRFTIRKMTILILDLVHDLTTLLRTQNDLHTRNPNGMNNVGMLDVANHSLDEPDLEVTVIMDDGDGCQDDSDDDAREVRST